MALQGCATKLKIVAAVVAGLNSISLSMGSDMIDVTTFDSACWKEFVAGLKGATISASGFYDTTDTNGQVALRTALLAGSQVDAVNYYVDGSVNGFTASVFVSSFNVGADPTGSVTLDFELQITGAVTLLSA